MNFRRVWLTILLLVLSGSSVAFAQVQTHTAHRKTISRAQNVPPSKVPPPATFEKIQIPSNGARMNGLICLAAGTVPHPIVIILHGYPGNDKNLDLAQAVRKAGYHALYFDYRGTWVSDGTFSFTHAIEDTTAVLAWVRAPPNVARYHIDTTRISLVGHSFGGWLALMVAGREVPGVSVAALAAWNVGWAAKRFGTYADERASNFDVFKDTTDDIKGPVHAKADELLNEMTDHAEEWDYMTQAGALKDHPLLLVAATHDTEDEGIDRHSQLAGAVRTAGGKRVRVVTFDDDHPFSSNRHALAHTIVSWLKTESTISEIE